MNTAAGINGLSFWLAVGGGIGLVTLITIVATVVLLRRRRSNNTTDPDPGDIYLQPTTAGRADPIYQTQDDVYEDIENDDDDDYDDVDIIRYRTEVVAGVTTPTEDTYIFAGVT
ncbi:uncharacterized protein LOC141910061 [Tubulanus polymorphus]|uniref:uncharacterized protein LOC141910061 n=1 Tax=Tubulanus polymorphus TaxID=672921 RepID=UPI003DA5FB0D